MSEQQQSRRHQDEQQFGTSELQLALHRGEFEPYYQPIVGPAGYWRGAEILIRWRHPQHGLLSPAAFLPPLEGAQLLVKATQHMLARVAQHWRRCCAPEDGPFFISFNTSRAHLHSSALPDDCRDFLDALGDSALDLMVEMPERGSDLSMPDCAAVFQQLELAGVAVALDDFGVGDARLHQFASGQIACVKIDQSFVREIGTNPSYRRLIAKIVQFARGFDAYVTAEGVESAAQYRWLRRLGVKLFQGYLFDRPLPASTFFERLPLMREPQLA